jgi:hypothetical protein
MSVNDPFCIVSWVDSIHMSWLVYQAKENEGKPKQQGPVL